MTRLYASGIGLAVLLGLSWLGHAYSSNARSISGDCPRANGHFEAIYYDLGNEACADDLQLEGWAGTEEVSSEAAGFLGDISVQHMEVQATNTLAVPVREGVPVSLTWWIGQGDCDDAWTLVVNGEPLASSTSERSLLPIVYTRDIPDDWVTSGSLQLTFHNESVDPCGVAGVWGILVAQAAP